MRGTEVRPPRCVALQGEIGDAVHCSIYPLRASPCREFKASWVDGIPNERCDRARATHGLAPLPPPAGMIEPDATAQYSLPPAPAEAGRTCDASGTAGP